ncbi:hypothetical protein CPAV1605_212 [seawater metagenome]|uniref:Uncharacterized protein n=1 Tax=seawater metagenome TaxID=1561972 RepID=A0A5E8CLU5_9ZZZZ
MEYCKNVASKKNLMIGIPCSLVALQYYFNPYKIFIKGDSKKSIDKILNNPENNNDLTLSNDLDELSKKIDIMSMETFNHTLSKIVKKKEVEKLEIISTTPLPTYDKAQFINSQINELYFIIDDYLKEIKDYKLILGNEEFKNNNFPRHISINGKFTNVEYEKVYINSEVLRSQIFDLTESIKEDIFFVNWFKTKNEIDQFFKYLENKEIKTSLDIIQNMEKLNYSIKDLPTVNYQAKILLDLENVISKITSYFSEINVILGIVEYIVNSGLKENLTFKIKDNNIKLLECNKIIKESLESMKNNMVIKIKEIVNYLDDIIWFDQNQLFNIHLKYVELRNPLTKKVSLTKLVDIDIENLSKTKSININALLEKGSIDIEDFFHLNYMNII